ncbi:MAG: glycosyltransferase family A protein [Alphaproteobacteria bacterium]
MRHIISLTAIPPRFADLGLTLHSLLRQKSRPEAVELWIPHSYRRFPQWGGGLPDVPEGVTLRRVDVDYGPATKVLPALREWRGQAVEILFSDDDRYFSPDWSLRFLKVRRERPGVAICATGTTVARMGGGGAAYAPLPRALPAPPLEEQWGYQLRRLFGILLNRPDRRRLALLTEGVGRSGHVDIAEGYRGIMIRPDFLDDAVYDIPPVLWTVDDVWISGHLARRGVAIWADRRLNRSQMIRAQSDAAPLYKSVIEGADREAANLACIDYMRRTYGIWGGVAIQST